MWLVVVYWDSVRLVSTSWWEKFVPRCVTVTSVNLAVRKLNRYLITLIWEGGIWDSLYTHCLVSFPNYLLSNLKDPIMSLSSYPHFARPLTPNLMKNLGFKAHMHSKLKFLHLNWSSSFHVAMVHCTSHCYPHLDTAASHLYHRTARLSFVAVISQYWSHHWESEIFMAYWFFLIIKQICKSFKTLSSAHGETHTASIQKLCHQMSYQDFCKVVMSQLNGDHPQPNPLWLQKKQKKPHQHSWCENTVVGAFLGLKKLTNESRLRFSGGKP